MGVPSMETPKTKVPCAKPLEADGPGGRSRALSAYSLALSSSKVLVALEFSHVVVSIYQNGWFIDQNPMDDMGVPHFRNPMDDLGVPHFRKPPYYHIVTIFQSSNQVTSCPRYHWVLGCSLPLCCCWWGFPGATELQTNSSLMALCSSL